MLRLNVAATQHGMESEAFEGFAEALRLRIYVQEATSHRSNDSNVAKILRTCHTRDGS